MVSKLLEKHLKKVVLDLGYKQSFSSSKIEDIVCTISKNPQFGDYSTNVALQLAKQSIENGHQSADEIANKIVDRLQATGGSKDYLEKVEVAGNGFINFFIKSDMLLGVLDQEYGESNLVKKSSSKTEKIIVEFTDPNPFKELHIGHVFSNAVGESLSRLFEYTRAKVWRANFFGDVGMHAAKAIFGIQRKLKEEKLEFEDLEIKPLSDRIKFMGQAYSLGASAYEEDPKAKKEMEQLNLLIFIAAQKHWQETKNWKPRVNYKKYIQDIDEDKLNFIQKIWVNGRAWSLDYFEAIYKLLGTKFDGYYPESLTGEWGYDFVIQGLKKGIFEESEGAIVYKGEKAGLHTRVFINKLGLPTYETKDIGNAPHKYSEFEYDKSLIVTANEIDEYFKVVIAAMKEVNPELGHKTIHLGHGVVRLKSGKMSSRTGKVITFYDIFEPVREKVSSLLKDFPEQDKDRLLNIVAIGAIKFAMLKHQPSMDTIFDIDKSVALEGDSGPYIQYTYARAKSILKKAVSWDRPSFENVKDLEVEERALLHKIEYFEVAVEEATKNLRPNTIASYLLELAGCFNSFYQKYRIVNAEAGKKELRLALTESVAAILKIGLHLLGIEAPERM